MITSPIAQEFLGTGRCESCQVIDLHAHYGHFSGIHMPNHTPEQMIATLDRCGVEKVVSSGHTALADMTIGNAEMLDAVAPHAGRWYAYLTYNPNYAAEGRQQLEGYLDHATYAGIKFHPSFHAYPITGDDYKPALEFAADLGLNVLTHTWGGSAYDSPRHLAEVARRYPNVVFLAGHSAFGEFEACMDVANEFPNVYLELTAAYRVNGLIERMVEKVGAHKIIFGCDLPWFDPHYAIGCIVMARISESARRQILRENALRLLARVARC